MILFLHSFPDIKYNFFIRLDDHADRRYKKGDHVAAGVVACSLSKSLLQGAGILIRYNRI